MLIRFSCLALGLALFACQTTAAATVSLSSLLDEMTDRAAVASFPDPAYTCRQASSYDKRSKNPKKPGWFANDDRSMFLRKETIQGRTEWVMMDDQGPGAIVRWWVTSFGYKGTVRIYLDGSDKPTIEMPVKELIGGNGMVGAPLSEERANGRNLYLPIPYAKGCKVTYDNDFHQTKKREHLLYYQINYRSYAPGTAVQSFNLGRLAAAQKKIEQVQQSLLHATPTVRQTARTRGTIEPGLSRGLTFDTPGAIEQLAIKLDAKDPTQALRSTILVATFDGEETIWCPVSDFFGSGVGVNPYKGWYRQIDKDGTMTCWWVMPFKGKCEIQLKNLGKQTVNAEIFASTRPWKWNDRSMYFHATWRQERNIKTEANGKKAFDWNYLTAKGQGVFVGDTLTLLNRSARWWGEGDEKIYVDGEKFPSHFGTGTEDYYGYAWCTPKFFESPFHAQPRAEGPKNFGNITNTRVRLLDAIPFDKSFLFDMEIWHWATTKVDYAVTTYWYGRPGATTSIEPMPNEARRPVQYKTDRKIPGFDLLNYTRGTLELQPMKGYGKDKWKDNNQLWWRDARPGESLTLGLTAKKQGDYKILLALTKAPDYAVVQFKMDGQPIGKRVDLYAKDVTPPEPFSFGPLPLSQGKHKFTIEIVGANKKAVKNYMVGIDQIQLEPK